VLERFEHIPRVKVIDNPEQIVPTGLNEAIRQSRGDVIVRVDGHVIVAKNFISQSIAALHDHADAWASGGVIVHSAKTPMGKAIAAAMSHRLGVGNAMHRDPTFEGYGEGTAFPAIHRWVFDRIGFYDEDLVRNQDDEFYFRLRQAGGKFFITPEIKYKYYVREKLGHLFRQYYQYSFWRVPVIRKHRQPTTIRQMIPSLFYLTMTFALVAGIVLSNAWIAFGIPTVYLTMLLMAGIFKIPAVGPNVALRIPLAIITMHAAYALGMIHGACCLVIGVDGWQRSNRRAVALSR
jgi:GT2 family glycosyltransferase